MQQPHSNPITLIHITRLAAYALPFLLPAGAARLMAQTTSSTVVIAPDNQLPHRDCLVQTGELPVASSAACPSPTVVNGGLAWASTSGDLASLSGMASAQVQQTGASMTLFDNATTRWLLQFNVLGDKTANGDGLLLHFATAFTSQVVGLAPSRNTLLTSALVSNYGIWQHITYADGTSEIRLTPGGLGGAVSVTPEGLDLIVPFSFVGGLQDVTFFYFARVVIADGQPAGATLGEAFNFRISGAELVSEDGTRQTVAFDNRGVGTVVGNFTTTPEPASMALMATGLIGVAAVASRRRTNTGLLRRSEHT